MLKTRVMPCLLLRDGALIKTVRFSKFKYIGDPINAVRIYNDMEVDEIVILDIKAGIDGKDPEYKLISEIAGECFMPLCYGGGIRTVSQMKRLFNLGVEKICINTIAGENPDIISEAAEIFGSQSIIVSVDVKKNFFGRYCIYIKSGRKKIKYDLIDYVRLLEEKGAGEIFLNSIERDGTWEGYDLYLIKKVTDNINIPLIACGGAGKFEDFRLAVENGASALAAGSMVVFQKKDLGVLIKFPSQKDLSNFIY